MALIRCKECGGLVSDKAHSCPHCGAQINKVGTITRQNLSNIECRNKAIETEISALLNYAHKAMDGWNIESAYEYYRLVLEKDEENWEAIFYTAFLLAYPSEESFKANVIAAINRCVSLFSTGTFAEQYVCNALNEIFGRLSWALSKKPFRIDMLYAYGDIINDMLPRYKDITCKVWLHAIKFDVRRVGWNTYCRKIEEFNDTKGIEKLNSIKAERERITQECADEDKRDKKLIAIGGIVLSALFVFFVWGAGYLMGFWGDYGKDNLENARVCDLAEGFRCKYGEDSEQLKQFRFLSNQVVEDKKNYNWENAVAHYKSLIELCEKSGANNAIYTYKNELKECEEAIHNIEIAERDREKDNQKRWREALIKARHEYIRQNPEEARRRGLEELY